MQTHTPTRDVANTFETSGSVTQGRVGRVLSAFAALFLLVDSAAKLVRAQAALEATRELGYSPDVILGLGLVLLGCVVTYIVPRTSAFGALLLTGYLGGAVATHVRVGNPLATHVLFPIYVATLLWAGLLLRDPALRVLIPLRRATAPRA